MKFFSEFKTFIVRGNVMDMAVGVVMGSAFTAIVNSLVKDIITPCIAAMTGSVSFENLVFTVNEKLTIPYGNFIQAIVNFLIIAFAIFCTVKALNTLKDKAFKQQKEEAAEEEPKPTKDQELLTEIRDLLKNK